MRTPSIYTRYASWWHFPRSRWLLVIFLSIALCMVGGQLTAASPPSTVPKVYVGVFQDNVVAVVDTATNRVLRTIQVPKGPHGLVLTPDGRKVYVASDGASTVSVIDTTTDQVVSSIEVGPNPHGLAISPDGRKVLVMAFGANQALVIDATNDRVIGQIPVPLPHNGAISPDGRLAYVGSQQQGDTAIVVLDVMDMAQVGKVGLDKTPRGLDLSPDGSRLYFTVAGLDAVQVLDTATRQIVRQIATGASPHITRFIPHTQVALVVDQGPAELAPIEPAQNAVSVAVKVGKAPHWLAISSDGGTAYVTDEGANDVSVIDLASRQVTATIPVGNAPRKIAVQPGSISPVAVPTRQPAERSSHEEMLTISNHGTKEVQGMSAVALEADDYYFAPTFLRGEPGQTLTLEIDNESGTLHNLSVPALQLDKDIPPRGKVAVQVTLPVSGAVRFFCKFHAAIGMSGEMLAGDASPPTSFQGARPQPTTGSKP